MAASQPSVPAKDEAGDSTQFTSFMKKLVSVPHSVIKARLEAEKAAKPKRVSRAAGV